MARKVRFVHSVSSEVAMKRMKSLWGWYVTLVVAFIFSLLYGPIFMVFEYDEFKWVPSYPRLETPSDATEYVLRVLAIILIAWFAVQARSWILRINNTQISKIVATGWAALLFSFIYWWSELIILWMAKGAEAEHLGVDLWSWGVWSHRWASFGRADLMAFIPLSLLVIHAELFRRWLDSKPAA